MPIQTKRVYDPAAPDDGVRILVDRLWPRGLTKEKAAVELWLKEAAPSNGLRKEFGNHDPARYADFKRLYFGELDALPKDSLKPILDLARKQRVTLLFGARDTERNNAVALKEYLERGRRSR